jgi:hypothetical protein
VLLVARLVVVVVVVLADRELIKERVLFAESGEAGFLSLCCDFLPQEGVALQEHVDEGTSAAMTNFNWAVMSL